MAKNEPKGRTKNPSLVERLFGELTDLTDEEIDFLYDAFSHEERAAEAVYRIAEAAAVGYRKKNLPVPDHVQAAIRAMRPFSNLEDAKPGLLQKLVEKLSKPVAGPVSDLTYAWRKRTELTEGDRAILDTLTGELQKDWKEEEPE